MKIQLVENWRHLWKSLVMWFAATGLVLPEVLQVIADETTALVWLNDGWKSIIRITCLVLVILARPVKQASVSDPKATT